MSLCTVPACMAEAVADGRCATHPLQRTMTQAEFLPGWLLLVNQPWGHRYNKTDRQGQPTAEARLQLEFYFAKLKQGSVAAWRRTAEQYAAGSDWPSVEDLKRTMRAYEPILPKLPAPREATDPRPMPPEIRALVCRLFGAPRRTFGCWVDDAVPEETV